MDARRRRLLLFFLGLLLGSSFVSLSWFNYLSARDSLHHEIVGSSLPLLRENLYSAIREEILPAMNVSSAMAQDAFLIDWVRQGEQPVEAVQNYLSRLQRAYGYISTFFVSAQTRIYYHYKGINKVVSPEDPHDVWYYGFVARGRPYELDVDLDEAGSSDLTVFLNYRVEDDEGRFLGVTGVGLKMEDLSRSLRARQREYRRQLYLVDENGTYQVHSDLSLIEQRNLHREPGVQDIAAELLRPEAGPQDFSFVRDGHRVLAASRYLPEIGWYLIVEQDEDEALGPARFSLVMSLIAGLGISLLVLGLCAWVLRLYTRRLEEAATTDLLTRISNRRGLEEELQRARARALRQGQAYTLLLFDLDEFKQINDRQGHQAGDAVLQELCRRISALIRPGDRFGRWGGDEFALLVEGDGVQARALAERLRQALAQSEPGRPDLPTLSLGLATYEKDFSVDEWIRQADQGLYRAKSLGRNRIETGPGASSALA